jgi:hypothetical protein
MEEGEQGKTETGKIRAMSGVGENNFNPTG